MTKNREIAENIFSNMRKLGYKPYDINYGDGYFIFDMGEDSVVHFRIKNVWKSWRFGMWINSENLDKTEEITDENRKDNLVVRLFCQNEDWLDKFKPTRSALCVEFDRNEYQRDEMDYKIRTMLGMIKKHPILCYNDFCGEYAGYVDYSFFKSFIRGRLSWYYKIIEEKVVCGFWLAYTKLKLQLAKHDKIIKSVEIYDFEKENEGWSTNYRYRPLPTFVDGVTEEQILRWYDKWFRKDKYGKFGYYDYAIDIKDSINDNMRDIGSTERYWNWSE